MITEISCKFCASRCGMLINHEGKKFDRISGNPNHTVSRGWSCARGRAATKKYYRDKLSEVK
jgi:anaerobic selenocysteine-containing dehydrogenase